MNICIVTPTLNGGGAERVAVNLSNQYAAQGYNVTLVAMKAEGPNLRNVSDAVRVVDLKVRIRASFFKLLKVLKVVGPDIVISVIRDSNVVVGLCAPFLSAKCIFREANTLDAIESKTPISRAALFLFMRISYFFSDRIIANSNDTKRDLLRKKIVKDSKCVVIGNPVLSVNYELLIQEKAFHRWFDSNEYFVVLNVGRLHYQKNQDLLIRVFAIVFKKNSCARLIIIGEGGELDKLRQLAIDLEVGDVVDILPYQYNVYPYYKHSSLFLLTSRWEGFGNVIVEAMACETPVICAKCPGGPSMILEDGKYGGLVDPNVESLSTAILNHIEEKHTKVMVARAKEKSKEYSAAYVCKKYLSL